MITQKAPEESPTFEEVQIRLTQFKNERGASTRALLAMMIVLSIICAVVLVGRQLNTAPASFGTEIIVAQQ